MTSLFIAYLPTVRETILQALDSIADESGTIQADPLTATDEIMRAIELSNGGDEL